MNLTPESVREALTALSSYCLSTTEKKRQGAVFPWTHKAINDEEESVCHHVRVVSQYIETLEQKCRDRDTVIGELDLAPVELPEEEEEEEEVEEFEGEPDLEEAFILTPKGDGLEFSYHGKVIASGKTENEAWAALHAWAEKEGYYGSIYSISDHGNVSAEIPWRNLEECLPCKARK